MTNIEKEYIKRYSIDFEQVRQIIENNPEEDYDFFIKFKDNDTEAKEMCMGNTAFGAMLIDLIEKSDITVDFDGDGLLLNPKRCLQNPLELLDGLKEHIDFIFT